MGWQDYLVQLQGVWRDVTVTWNVKAISQHFQSLLNVVKGKVCQTVVCFQINNTWELSVPPYLPSTWQAERLWQ